MSKIEKQLEICPPAYMCKGPNRENFVSTGHKCGYCKGNGWFWGTDIWGRIVCFFYGHMPYRVTWNNTLCIRMKRKGGQKRSKHIKKYHTKHYREYCIRCGKILKKK